MSNIVKIMQKISEKNKNDLGDFSH